MSLAPDSESGLDPVLDLVHHVFHLKLSIDSYQNEINVDKGKLHELGFTYDNRHVENLKSLLVKWSNLPYSIWKKSDYIKTISVKFNVNSSLVTECIYEIVEECSSGNSCRLSSSSSAFLLLVLDSCSPACEGDLKICLIKLIYCINFTLAKKITLSSIKDEGLVKWNDLNSLKLLHFIPTSIVDWNVFGKFLNELKGFPDQFRDLLPFLGKFFSVNGKNAELVSIVERLSRRNSAVSAAILSLICENDSFIEYIDIYTESFVALLPSDNEVAREFIDKIPKTIVISKSLTEALMKCFATSSQKGKENISKFLAACFEVQVPSGVEVNFADLAAKELSSEATLSYLVQCAASLDQNGLQAFLKTNFKANQKFSVKSSILSGISKSRNYCAITEEITREIFSPSFIKESSGTSPVHNYFYVSAFSILINRPDLKIADCKSFAEPLSKPSGAATFCEKGFSSMDNVLAEMFLSQVVIPVVFEGLRPDLFNFCILAYSWFAVQGNKAQFSLIKKKSSLLTVEKIESLVKALDKVLDTANDDKASRIWTLFAILCDHNSLSSEHIALLCHNNTKLLGLGSGSWAELVRARVTDIPQFCQKFYETVILSNNLVTEAGVKTPAFYLLETLISLSPDLIKVTINLVDNVSSCLAAVLSFSPAQLELLSKSISDSKPQVKPVALVKSINKSSNSSPVAEDVSVTKEAISVAVQNLKKSISTILAASLAIPFHPNFSESRAALIMQILLALPKILDPKLSAFLAENLYLIASESLDGQGPLLISLYLHCIGMEYLISESWKISEDYVLAESVYQVIARNLEMDEIDFALLVVAKSIKLFKKFSDLNIVKDLLAKLQTVCSNVEKCDSRVVFDFVHALIEASQNFPKGHIALLVGLFIELAEIPDLRICSEQDVIKLNRALRSESPQIQLLILKFLAALIATQSNESDIQAIVNSDLAKTIWLLHYPIEAQSNSPNYEQDDVEDEVEPIESTDAYEFTEISTIASELCALLNLGVDSNTDFLSEIVLLETEKGRNEFFIHNLQENYISALGHGLVDSKGLSAVSRECGRLLAARTTPNGIVRLTKNVDRSKLDFTKQTRKALLKAVAIASKLSIKSENCGNFIKDLVSFCFEFGFTDTDEVNCEIVFSTVLGIIDSCERETDAEALFDQLQGCLNTVPSGNDRVKVYAVILVGRASSKVPSFTASPTRVFDLIERIRGSLDIPSEKVQKAVADTLIPLFRSLDPEDKRIGAFVYEFSGRLRNATEDYGCLRGAAFGLAALIEACGTGIIRSFDIFNVFSGGLGKKNEAAACASLAAIEIVAIRCGTAFEPYIAPLVPGVLEALGDSKGRVREDAEACADAMMTALSPLSVSLILPPLLDMAGMDGCDPRYSWRTKLGAVTWLGSMANLAPKVLTTALPRIIPALIVALTDAHEKVHLAAHHALAVKYAAIIRSPEIKAALPAILRALSDPPKFAASCLGDIIGTSFCHAVDGPSLALLEPLLSRALRERGTGAMSEAKRRAILIIANLGSLMDPTELKPYLINLVPALRGVLGDAVPQVRSGAARTLGTLVKMMMNSDRDQKQLQGNHSIKIEAFDSNSTLPQVLLNIVPECLDIINSTLPSVSAIDRAGAALAIAQVSAARGMDYLIALVNQHIQPILFSAENKSTKGASREALLHLCAALPAALPSTQVSKLYESIFTPERIFTILQGCASEDEGVREISSKTVRSLLLRQALLVDLRSALNILLQGASDARWRLRLTSFTILSDLLPVLSLSGDGDACDTKNRTVSSDMRAKLLSRIFFGRFDTNGLIRNAAFSLWKSIVTHPPRVILEILPVIVDDCVKLLATEESESESESDDEEYESESESESESENQASSSASVSKAHKIDRYEMASSALQDILVKLSDRILMPFLRRLEQSGPVSCGILLAARIVASVVIVPNLIPPHQRNASDLVVPIGRAQIDEALKIVLALIQKGLLCQDSEETVRVAVGLFAKISTGLTSSPALFDRIIIELFFESERSTAALISVLNRRPQMLLTPLVNRFKKLGSINDIDWDWWTEVLAAPGPFLAAQSASLLSHLLLKLDCTGSDVPCWPLIDVLLASMAAYDPDMSYGDCEGDDYDADAELEDSVDSGLFSFAQLLETLWSAKNMTSLAARLIEYFALQGSHGVDRFYDIWLDRLLQSVCAANSSDNSCSSEALIAVIERAVERDDSTTVISAFNQSVQVRSQVSRCLSSSLTDKLLMCYIKTLTLPTISDTSLPATDRLEACKLLQSVLIAPDSSVISDTSNINRLTGPACTALLGALIRCLSDRSDTSKTERLKAALLPVLLFVLRKVPLAVGKPFHPQLARLAVNVLKDLVAAVSIAGTPIDMDESHARGQIALTATQLAAFLLAHMSRVDVLLDELQAFRVENEDEEGVVYDELSTRNARKCLLFVLDHLHPLLSTTTTNIPALSAFVETTVKFFLVLPSSEIEIINLTAKIGRKLSPHISTNLESFINSLV